MAIKKSEIECIETDGWFQIVIRDHCVTEPVRSKDAAYKGFIKELIDAIEEGQRVLGSAPLN
jgi:hypothetical protein